MPYRENTINTADWLIGGFLALIVACIKGIEAYRRKSTYGDGVIAVAEGLTAIVVWWVSSAIMIGMWAAWFPNIHVSNETFSAAGVALAHFGLRKAIIMFMRIRLAMDAKAEALENLDRDGEPRDV